MKKVLTVLLLLVIQAFCFAQVKLPRLISNGMVLQRGESVKIWGWAAPNEKVNIDFIGKKYQVVANEKGEWFTKIVPQKAGGPFQMTLKASNTIVIDNILFGDVWLCSGQSNMELEMNRLVDKYPNEIINAKNDKIRQFLVPDEYEFNKEREDFGNGSWKSVDPKTVLNFSGVAYFFAKEIYSKYKVPIGLINAALGGSPAQAWISERGLKVFPSYLKELQKFKNQALIDSMQKAEAEMSKMWYGHIYKNDTGLQQAWKKNDEMTKSWSTINMPANFNSQGLGNINGVIWLKKEFYLSAKPTVGQAKLLLGTMRDADSTFVNAQFVGNTSYFYPPRRYLFATDLLKEGKNMITVRLVVNNGNAEFVKDKPYQLITGKDTLKMDGAWSYAVGVKSEPSPSSTFFRWKAGGLYNAMIAPLKNYGIKGAVWYQGESNTGKPNEYGALMTSLIADWRITFAKPALSFLYVQLPNNMEVKTEPSESGWAELREQQRQLLKVPQTAMAVTIDLGEWNDIHPLNKEDVGKRLALQAERLVYGNTKIVSTGPIFKKMVKDGNQLVLTFDNIGDGLVAKHGDLKHFAIAAADGKYFWAQAKIVGNKVVLWNAKVTNPIKVRYAWADNPSAANLFNKAGLPASPFQASIAK
ncbi:Glycosyl hydrolases family 2, sugar binding domain [compost metagenome]